MVMSDNQKLLLQLFGGMLVICMLWWCVDRKENYGTLPQMTMSRIVPFPSVNQDFLTVASPSHHNSTNYAEEDDQYQHRTIMNVGPYPAPVRSPTDTNIKDYIKAGYLHQLIPRGGSYGPADPTDDAYAYAAYTHSLEKEKKHE